MSGSDTTPAKGTRPPGDPPRLPPPPVADLHLSDPLAGLAIGGVVMTLCVVAGIGDSALAAAFEADRGLLSATLGLLLGLAAAAIYYTVRTWRRLQAEVARRRAAEIGAQASEQRFRDFAEASAHYTWECGPDMKITFLSEGITRITGERPEDVLRMPMEERRALVSAGDPAEEQLRQISAQRLPYMDMRVRRRALDGRIVHLAFSGKPYFGADGSFLGYRGTGRDVTEEVRAQREAESARRAQALAESANTAKSQFLANMSHELRTPLNAILGFSEMIAGEMLGPVGERRYRGYAVDINASAKHLLDIVNDLLDMARIEVGRYRVEPERVRLGQLGDEVAAIVHGMAAAARIAIDRGGLDQALTVEVDRRAIKQVLLNLLSNALRHTPEGGRIELSAEQRADGTLAIAVADTGCGIEPERLETMFEPFQRSTAHVARQQGGVGLGLWISRELVRLHGGDLELASTPGQGTTATVVLPGERIVLAA